MSKQINPLENRVLVCPADPARITKGGIHLPDNAREKPTEGTVVAVGPGKRGKSGDLIKAGVAVGDMVIYSRYAGTEIKIEGEGHVLLRETDLLCTITEVLEPAQVTS